MVNIAGDTDSKAMQGIQMIAQRTSVKAEKSIGATGF